MLYVIEAALVPVPHVSGILFVPLIFCDREFVIISQCLLDYFGLKYMEISEVNQIRSRGKWFTELLGLRPGDLRHWVHLKISCRIMPKSMVFFAVPIISTSSYSWEQVDEDSVLGGGPVGRGQRRS